MNDSLTKKLVDSSTFNLDIRDLMGEVLRPSAE